MKKLAIIDDYERAAQTGANWSELNNEIRIAAFHDHLEGEDALAERLVDFEIVFMMRERTPFPRSLLVRLPKLELLITSGMRNASIDLDAARELGVTVCGTPILPYPAAEHAWALILALAKRVPVDDAAIRAGHWGSGLNLGLKGKTLGVIGLGKLGQQVARIGLAFEMKVVCWSHNLTAGVCAEIGVRLVSKQELLQISDFVSIHLVLGDRSRGLIGATEFEAMRDSAYLINTSRGPIVDESALVKALAQGSIAGAGIDVFDIEPLAENHPLRTLPNTVLTPHQGYVTRENYAIFYATAIDNVRCWMRAQPINLLT